MAQIQMYTKDYCPFCIRAKALLNSLDHEYEEFEISYNVEKEAEMIERSKRHTVAQIFIGDLSIGGSDDLVRLVESGDFNYLIDLADGGADPTSTLTQGE